MGNVKIKTKFAVLLAGLIIVSLLLSTAWMSNTQREQTENELR